MFPQLQFCVSGLSSNRQYRVFIAIDHADPHHWKYQNGKWITSGQAEQLPQGKYQ